jgi:hypothetical protein
MTEITPVVSKIWLYPVKALDGVEVSPATLLSSGALEGDRKFALFDASGHFVNGKRQPRVHQLRSQFDLERGMIHLQTPDGQTRTFPLEAPSKPLEDWLEDYFEFPVQLQQNHEMGFPDDTKVPGPTIVSVATLEAIASWYPDLDLAAVRRRFRSNIEISGVPAFWEDQLFGQDNQTVSFQIGDVQFQGVHPCQRCVVVTRDAETGAAYPNFQKTFVAQRQASLPPWAERSRFNHFFRLAVNTRLNTSEAGKTIAVGDRVRMVA